MATATSPPGRSSRDNERIMRLAMLAAGVVLAVVAGYLALLRVGGSVRTLSYDLPFILGHRPGGVQDVRIVYLDELDGKFVDRRSQAALLDKLNEAGARAVVYDLIFDLPSEDPAVDREFAAAMLRFRGVDENGEPVPGAPRRSILLACGRQTLQQTGITGEQLIPPTDELLAAADDFGLVALIHDKKFTVRELTTGTPDEPSVTWKAAVALGAPLREADRLSPRWLNYAGPPPDPAHPGAAPAIPSCGASDIMNGAVPGFLRDKVVVVGAKPGMVGAAAGLDLFSTPFHRIDLRGDLPLMSGVEIQATVLANLLRQNWLVRSAPRHDNWLIAITGVLAGLAFTRLRPVHAILCAPLCMVLLVVLGTLVMHYQRVWFPWSVAAFIQIPVALVWGTAAHFCIERFFRVKLGEEQLKIREAFSKYLSPQMLERLTAEDFQMRVGGEKIQGAMMFTDLENFTNMCERVADPERIVATLNDYFERTTCHIFDHDGVVIKFIGDAIFAAWGAPIHEPEAALKAARAAWRLFQSDKMVVDGVALKTRIGVHYGEVVAGNIGSARRVDYTLIGDAVNLAARLESLNKTLGTHILISEEVSQRLGGEFRTRKVGHFKVKGRNEVTVIHELLGPAAQPEVPEWIQLYHQALDALAANDPKQARALFNATIASRGQEDGPSRFFLGRLNIGEPTRNGVVEMTEK
jgi:class 3 adenylate cyclase/CHASE2 domain-containing sensor protein